jgi:hypothetical protein
MKNSRFSRQEPVGLANVTVSSSGNFLGIAAIHLDRLLKQRIALRKRTIPFALPPQRGGLRNLSGRAVSLAAETAYDLRTLSYNPTNP